MTNEYKNIYNIYIYYIKFIINKEFIYVIEGIDIFIYIFI